MKNIQIRNLYKIYNENKVNEFTALKNINLEIKSGEIVILKGVSGSGKSTLLSLLGGLSKPSRGDILVGNENIAKLPDIYASKYRNEEIGFIFQSFNLINGLSVYENVMAPLALHVKYSQQDIDQKVKRALQLANIEHKQNQSVFDLSGGERQRCAIARALVANPEIILADEPTANLDKGNSLGFVKTLKIFKELQKTVVIATHDVIFDGLDVIDKYINIQNGEIL